MYTDAPDRLASPGLLSRALFPLLVIGAGAAGYGLLQLGAAPAMVSLSLVLGLTALVAALERLLPQERAWNRSQGDLATDLGFLATLKVPDTIAQGVGHALAAGLSVWASGALGGRLWPSGWPVALQLAVLLLTGDLAKYWLHRLSHERPGLWRFHAVHHAPDKIYVLNGLRIHPVNLLWLLAIDVTLPIALGVAPEVAALAGALRGAVAVLQHANIALRPGVLNWIFSTPELHRWHHSTDLAEGNKNYGATLILWDVLFGTRYLPADRARPAAVGVSGPPLPRRWLGQILWPFCGARLETGCVPGAIRGWVR